MSGFFGIETIDEKYATATILQSVLYKYVREITPIVFGSTTRKVYNIVAGIVQHDKERDNKLSVW